MSQLHWSCHKNCHCHSHTCPRMSLLQLWLNAAAAAWHRFLWDQHDKKLAGQPVNRIHQAILSSFSTIEACSLPLSASGRITPRLMKQSRHLPAARSCSLLALLMLLPAFPKQSNAQISTIAYSSSFFYCSTCTAAGGVWYCRVCRCAPTQKMCNTLGRYFGENKAAAGYPLYDHDTQVSVG